MVTVASIISTSGAGVSLEARVAGLYLSALLARSSGPGDEHATAIEHVAFQRTEPAAGFDDIHLRHASPTGVVTRTYMQVKRTLTGTCGDEAFRRPIADAARMLDADECGGAVFRIVASESSLSPRDVDRARRAAHLADDADEFWRRWRKRGGSSAAERRYTDAVEAVIEREIGRADAVLAWRLIARMGIVVVDADQGGSQAVARAVDLLSGSLASRDRNEAVQLFETLCHFAQDAAAVAGGVDRARLLGGLAPRHRLAPLVSMRSCLDRLASDGEAALADIRDDVAGVRLQRVALVEVMDLRLREARGLLVTGRAGTGKSVLLRKLAELGRQRGGGLIVLKHDRLVARSWSEQARLLGVETPLPRLVDEMAAGGLGLLVLDGLDRMMDAGFAGLVREIGAAIRLSATAANWRCLASSRDPAGAEAAVHEPFLDAMAPCRVGGPDERDLGELARAFPFLAPLMARQGYAELNRSLFFIDQMARNPSVAGASSELDLMRAWAGRGQAETPSRPSRDATLRDLGERRLVRPHGPLPKVGDGEALVRLASEFTIVASPYRDVVTFAHDVYEDWAVARALDARRADVPSLLRTAGQPLAWMRAVRLVAEIALDVDGAVGWRAFHDRLLDRDLDPIWRRLTLTAMLHSPRASSLLDAIEPVLLADGAELMGGLLATLLSLEVRPHPGILSSPEFDILSPDDRRRRSRQLAMPRSTPWRAFMAWSVRRWSGWPRTLVPSLARITLTWLRLPIGHGKPTVLAVRQCVTWLRELDAMDAMPFGRWEERRSLRRGMGLEGVGSDDRLRTTLLLVAAMGADAAVGEVDAYMADALASGRRSGAGLIEVPGRIPAVLPARFVDLVLSEAVMPHDRDEPLHYALDQGDGLRDLPGFFPASPRRGGFDLLFATDENEALRLLSGLGEAAAAVWRRRQVRRGLTPRPLNLVGNGFTAELWGDEHVFKWSRGLLGPHVLGSLFLAADRWLADGISAGRAVGPLCAKLLSSSHLVASAGLCLAAATDRAGFPEDLRTVLPLLVEPRLWRYDLRRFLDDRSGSAFGVGWRPGDETALRAAADLRDRRLGQLPMVEGLVLPLLFSSDEALKAELRDAVGGWRVEDLASHDEELDEPAARAELEGELESWRAKADTANWRLGPGLQDGTHQIEYVVPQSLRERARQARERRDAFDAPGQLLAWAFGEARSGTTAGGQTFAEALPIAKALDRPDLFDHVLGHDAADTLTAQGVAAVAAAVAAHGEVGLVEAEEPWLLSVFRRAVAIDHGADPIHCESTFLHEDPKASAARGLGALTMRGMAKRDGARTWLGLVSSPFRDIAKAALEPAAAYAASHPCACAVALFVCAESMIYQWHPLDVDFEERMRRSRAGRARLAVDRATALLESGRAATGLRVPHPVTEPFVAVDASNPCAGDPSSQFDAYRAAAVWAGIDLTGAYRIPEVCDLVVAYVRDALTWYASFMRFQDGRRGRGRTSRRPDWEATLGAMGGRLAYSVPASVALERLVGSAAAIPDPEARGNILAHMLDGLGNAIVAGERPVDPDLETIWRAATRPLFEAARQGCGDWYDPDEAPLTAAALALHDMPVFPPEWPRAVELKGLLDDWVANCATYRFSASTLRRIVLQSGGAFVPSPGLDWLMRMMDAHGSHGGSYWLSPAGGALGEILLHLWTRCSPGERLANVATFRTAAAHLADRGVVAAAEVLPEIALVQANA